MKQLESERVRLRRELKDLLSQRPMVTDEAEWDALTDNIETALRRLRFTELLLEVDS